MGNTPRKIVVFSPFFPPHIGGLESHSAEFSRFMAERGISVTIFTPRLPTSAAEHELIHDRVSVFRFPAWEPVHNYPLPAFWPFWWSGRFFSLFRKLLHEKPDLVLSRTRFFATSLLAVIYATWKRVPHVHIEHGSDFAHFNSPLKTAIGKLYDIIFGRFVLRSADLVIANSHASRAFVQKLSGRHDCEVIYRGIESERIASLPRASFRPDVPVMIGYLGRLIDGKGVADLITALSALPKTSFHLMIIGDGPERKRLETLMKEKNLEEHVTFFGHCPFDTALSLLKRCDIVVNPSYTEGIPTSIVEAVLCRKAIIATDVGGTREIISGSNDGFLIPPQRPDILAKHLEVLMSHPELRTKFGDAAYAEVREKFSWDRSIDRYLELFAKLLGKKKK